MTAADVSATITSVQAISNQVLATIETVDPAVDVPATEAGTILNLLAQLTTISLAALTKAQGTAISAASIAALAPDATPLTAPTA